MAIVFAAGCNRGVDLTLAFPDGATGKVDVRFERSGLVVINQYTPHFLAEGSRTIEVATGGRYGASDLALVESFGEVRIEVATEGEELLWRSTDGVPVPPEADVGVLWFSGEDVRTELPVAGDPRRTPTLVPSAPGDGEADLLAMLRALTTAPRTRVKEGASWTIEVPPQPAQGIDEVWHRTYTVTGIEGSIVRIDETNRLGGPDGALPAEERQRRSRTRFDASTGLPVDYRMRDLRSVLIALDVEATFTWDPAP